VAVLKFGQKWLLLADFSYLRAISRTASGSSLFAESPRAMETEWLSSHLWAEDNDFVNFQLSGDQAIFVE
jgi:hypothetical protein